MSKYTVKLLRDKTDEVYRRNVNYWGGGKTCVIQHVPTGLVVLEDGSLGESISDALGVDPIFRADVILGSSDYQTRMLDVAARDLRAAIDKRLNKISDAFARGVTW